MRKILFTCLIVFFVLIITLGGIGAGWWFLSQKPVAQDQSSAISYKLEVPSGTGVKAVAETLEVENIIRSKLVFYLLARKENLQLKAGVYEVQSAMALKEIFDLLESGRQEHLVVSIPEGLTLSKVATLLESKDVISAEEFLVAAKNPALLAEYQVP